MERLNESRIGAVHTDAFAVRASTSTVSTFHAQHGAAILVGLDGDVSVTLEGREHVSGRVVVRDVGLPIRTFQLWRRLLAAVAALARLDATSAAHAAGFADLAHFSRTSRRMLGYSPTGLRDKLLQA